MRSERLRSEARLAELTREYDELQEFSRQWYALDAAVLDCLGDDGHNRANNDAFTSARNSLNRLFPKVQGRLGRTSYVREQFGRRTQHDMFGFLLQELPNIYTFYDPAMSHSRVLYHATRPLAASALERALGTVEAEIGVTKAGPEWSDSLADQASGLGLDGVQDYLDTAEVRLESGDIHEAIHNARMALERVAKSIANRVSDTVAGRTFGNALDVIEGKGLIDRNTRLHIGAPTVSTYGWLSIHGSHDDAELDSTLFRGEAEGRYAITASRAAIRLLLDGFSAFVGRSETPQSL